MKAVGKADPLGEITMAFFSTVKHTIFLGKYTMLIIYLCLLFVKS